MPRTTPSTRYFMRGASRSPNRRESRQAIGRAPMVKMSRRMPPTPVAAPWYGSMNDGWLCDSILNAATQPSPMSITPAFSPGPCTTRGPLVGNFFRCTRLDLYEQCSDHITEKMPSSVWLGSRPRICWMRLNSSGVMPCCATTSAVICIEVDYRWRTAGAGRPPWTSELRAPLHPFAFARSFERIELRLLLGSEHRLLFLLERLLR